MKNFFLYLILLLTLTACWWKQVQDNKVLSFWQFYIYISHKFKQIDSKKTLKDFEILYSYAAKDLIEQEYSKNSLLILKYSEHYPNNKKEFFNIVSDKFRREIPGTKIIKKAKIVKDNIPIYYFTYKVYDNLFYKENEKADYYGIQAYIFTNDKIYLISYTSSSQKTLNIILNSIEDLHINK